MTLSSDLAEARRLPKRIIAIYRDPETSEVDDEFESLVKAMRADVSDGAEIIQNGIVLAVVKGRRWEATRAGKKMLAMEKSGADILRVPLGWEKR